MGGAGEASLSPAVLPKSEPLRQTRGGSAGESGNCAAFAFTYQNELAKQGIPSLVRGCRLPDGQGHAITVTADGYVLDVRERWVVPTRVVGCNSR